MSWTTERAIAEDFTYRPPRSSLPGIVWVADVAPDRLLMFDNEREEQEYVIHARPEDHYTRRDGLRSVLQVVGLDLAEAGHCRG
jgi:hypothetical protein